jgi:glycosyltransferase involved in cell wall biosynthesis
MVFRHILPSGPFTVGDGPFVRVLGERDWSDALQDADWDYVYVVPPGLKKKTWIPRVARLAGPRILLELDHDNPWLEVADVLHVEAPRDRRLPKPHVVATPDPRDTIPDVPPVGEEGYVLTVFTPYGPEKGHLHIPALLEGMSRRLVWCFDLASFKSRKRRYEREIRARIAEVAHERLDLVESPTQEELYRHYHACAGYVCFSDREGLAWSVLDAVALGKPVCARDVGICKALRNFTPTDDFGHPFFRRYDLPPTPGFEALFEGVSGAMEQTAP